MITVLFACIHNAGRSQMSAAFFNHLADPNKARAISAGTHPAARVHPEVQTAMQELGIDLSDAVPQKLTPELVETVHVLVTMGCGDECPFVPGVRYEDWPFPDPKGQGIDSVRQIRDVIRERIARFVTEEKLGV
jgi:arsenate reductase